MTDSSVIPIPNQLHCLGRKTQINFEHGFVNFHQTCRSMACGVLQDFVDIYTVYEKGPPNRVLKTLLEAPFGIFWMPFATLSCQLAPKVVPLKKAELAHAAAKILAAT